MPALSLAKQAFQSTIWSLWLWPLLWALATVLTAMGTSDYRYALTIGFGRVVRLMTWSWLVAFVVFGGMSIGLRFHTGIMEDTFLWAETFRWSGRVFAIAPLMWGGLTLLGWNSVRDPWLKFPGGPPFRLQTFARRHPGLAIEEYENNLVGVWHAGEQVFFDSTELSNATLEFAQCDQHASEAALSGLPLFANSKCLFLVRRQSPEENEVRYVFQALGTNSFEVMKFYESRLESLGAELETTLRTDCIIVKTKTARWRIEARSSRGNPTNIYLSYLPGSRP